MFVVMESDANKLAGTDSAVCKHISDRSPDAVTALFVAASEQSPIAEVAVMKPYKSLDAAQSTVVVDLHALDSPCRQHHLVTSINRTNKPIMNPNRHLLLTYCASSQTMNIKTILTRPSTLTQRLSILHPP